MIIIFFLLKYIDPELNHIGIGVAMTEDTVILVEIFSRKYLSVYHV
jgi:hypothetical protein